MDPKDTLTGEIKYDNLNPDDYYENLSKIVEETYDSNVNKQTGPSNNNAEGLELMLQRERDFRFPPTSQVSNAKTIQTADKSATLWDFIKMVNKLVTVTMKDLGVEFVPDEGRNNILEPVQRIDHPYITYKIISRTPDGEFKPRHRQEISEKSGGSDGRLGEIYGQKFKCYVQFNFFANGFSEVEKIAERFEDMIFTYTGYFKQNGVAEILFHNQLTDGDYNIFRQQISVRNIIYRVEIEKLTVIFREKIKEITTLLNQKEA